MPQKAICAFQENFQSIYNRHAKKMGKNWIKGVLEALKVLFVSLDIFIFLNLILHFRNMEILLRKIGTMTLCCDGQKTVSSV